MRHHSLHNLIITRNGQRAEPSRMLKASGMVALLAFAIQFLAPTAFAQNFTCDDAEIIARAEQARSESAIYWSGEELPGRWSAACPIVITPADHSGGGATTFQFAGGEVYGWRMQISGRREALLADVVPHEVDHMVRASLVRRPIPRWLDEGCASDRESAASQQRLSDETRRLQASVRLPVIDAAWLDAMDYPAGNEEVASLYAVGHSLVEFLIERSGPRRLLDFQCDPRPPSAKLNDFYELDVAALAASFREWMEADHSSRDSAASAVEDATHAVECPLLFPGRPCDYDGPDLLTVFTSRSCGPCRQFWFDLDSDVEFRDAICSRFHLHRVDVDLQPMLAAQAGIEVVPTFVTRQGRITGYRGKAWLLEQLTELMPTESINDASVDTEPDASSDAVSSITPPTLSVAVSETVPSSEATAADTNASSTSEGPAFNPLPIAFTLLQWAGIIGGSAATGGVGTIAIWGVLQLLKRRRQRRSAQSAGGTTIAASATDDMLDAATSEDAGEASPRAPFPRQLDETCELLRLGRSEGRVAVLDTLRGMFLDDELDKLAEGSEEQGAWSKELKDAIDARVDEVAPLSVSGGSPTSKLSRPDLQALSA